MKPKLAAWLGAALLGGAILSLGACAESEEGELEKAGKEADKAVEEAGEKAEETLEEAGKALEDLGGG